MAGSNEVNLNECKVCDEFPLFFQEFLHGFFLLLNSAFWSLFFFFFLEPSTVIFGEKLVSVLGERFENFSYICTRFILIFLFFKSFVCVLKFLFSVPLSLSGNKVQIEKLGTSSEPKIPKKKG